MVTVQMKKIAYLGHDDKLLTREVEFPDRLADDGLGTSVGVQL